MPRPFCFLNARRPSARRSCAAEDETGRTGNAGPGAPVACRGGTGCSAWPCAAGFALRADVPERVAADAASQPARDGRGA